MRRHSGISAVKEKDQDSGQGKPGLFILDQSTMPESFQQHPPVPNGCAVSSSLKSSFGFRFHQAGRPNVYFRTQPDITSDPNQVWVSLDASDIKFENYTLENMPRPFHLASPREAAEHDVRVQSPKRQKRDPTATRNNPLKGSLMFSGFRVDRPIKVKVYEDLWRMILKESHPTVLLTIKNLSRKLHCLLEEQSIWKASRIKLHGDDMPGPPGEMTEQRYAHLLYGQGCDFQRSKCGSNVTKKVYWPFLRRMCDACFRRKTEKDKFVRVSIFRETGDTDVLELIPAGMTSSGKYTRTRRQNMTGWEALIHGVYLRSDLEELLCEYKELMQAGLSTAQVDDWKAKKRAKAQAFMAQCTDLEFFQKKVAAGQPRYRDARADFFVAQATSLTPPISKAVMERMMAFKMSLDSNHEPTMRSWADLKKKLLPCREAAERLLDLTEEREHYRRTGQPSLAIRNFRLLDNLRSRLSVPISLLPEQIFVLNIGQQQLATCKNHKVADADLVLLVLNGAFNAYQGPSVEERPQGTNADLVQGTYRLTLDDARMIVHDVVEPEVRLWDDNLRFRETLEKFKCVGCVRRDCTTRYTFDGLFQHIHEKHATYVAEGEDFHKLYRPFDDALYDMDFPWYTVEWPKNLPVAASHQHVSKDKKWLADGAVAYIPAAPQETVPAFLDRQPANNTGISAADFEENITYAAAKIRSTPLNVMCQMRIALQYALDRYALARESTKPSLATFIACLPRVCTVNEDFNLTFSCGVCRQRPNIPQSAVHTRPEPLNTLKEHFERTHSTDDWTLTFMDLPTDTQLASIIEDADEQLKKEKHATLEREASLMRNPRKKSDPNATMILEKPEAMAIFGQLFPRVHG